MHPDTMIHFAIDTRRRRELAAAQHRLRRAAEPRHRWRRRRRHVPWHRWRESLGFRLIETGLRMLPEPSVGRHRT